MSYLLTVLTYLQTRSRRDEAGYVVDWMMFAVLAVVVVGALIVAMTAIGSSMTDRIRSALGL